MGRPTSLTKQVHATLVQALTMGSTRELACQAAGISHETLRQWLMRGTAEKSGIYAAFVADLSRAEGQRVTTWLTLIENAAADGDWRAAAWKLERLYPHLFSKAATEVPAMLEAILAKLPKEVALQVLEAAGVLAEGAPEAIEA